MKPEGGIVAKERAAERASLPGRLAWRALAAHHATIGTTHPLQSGRTSFILDYTDLAVRK